MTVRGLLRRPLVAGYNRWLAFKASRERSVKMVARRNDRRAFEEIYGSADLLAEYLGPDRLAFYDEIARLCAPLEPRSVIDVGCGTGHLLAAVERACPEVERLAGTDYAEAAVDQLRQVVPRARGIVASLYDLDLGDEQFDLVLCTEVLEHLAAPQEALRILRRLCAPGGHAVITVPDGERDTYEGHLNFWDEGGFRGLVAELGRAEVRRTSEGDLVAVVAV